MLAVGDAVFQKRATRSSPSIRDAGKTLVVVTHDLGSVRSMADRAVWLSYGELKTEGSAGEVIGTYSDETMGQRHEDGGRAREQPVGSGEIKITKVTMLGPDGKPTQHVRTGDDVTIRYEYDAKVPVREPVFGLAVLHLSGPMLSGPNTRDTRRHPRTALRDRRRRHQAPRPAAPAGLVRHQRRGVGLPAPPRLRPARTA